ncbi:hypothetical protein ACP3V3_19710 [Vibrio sp. PNB22_3_1]
MKSELFNVGKAESAMHLINNKFETMPLPSGFGFTPVDVKHSMHWHQWNLETKSEFTSCSCSFGGRFDGESHRVFQGEVRVFLYEDGVLEKKYKAMLFARVGAGFNFDSHNLLENQDESKINSPFVYGDSVEEVLGIAYGRMVEALKRAETINYVPLAFRTNTKTSA